LWVEYLLNSPKWISQLDINRPNGCEGITALHQPIKGGRKSICRALLAAGADPPATFSSWRLTGTDFEIKTTCLHFIAEQGDPDLFFTKRLLGY
jgi:ankyrin repeat protein